MSDTQYSNPWLWKDEYAHRAKIVYRYFEKHEKEAIENSVKYTQHKMERNINEIIQMHQHNQHSPIVEVVKKETVEALYDLSSDDGKIAVLNFASYKSPGGMFMEGSIAQEEALCHESDLYNILSSDRLVNMFYKENRRQLNRGLYNSNLLYVPDVVFMHQKERRLADVITAAAPNKGTAQKYQHVSDEECDLTMRRRIQHILLAAIDEGVDTIILGAFGCGVFRNDPGTVAHIFKEELVGCPFRKVVMAVPGEKYQVFKIVFSS